MKTCILLLTFAATTIADDSHFSTSWEAFTEPYQSIEVAAPEAGRVAKVHVKRGSRVHAGDVLVELDNSVLQVKRKMAQKRIENRARLEAARVEFEKQQRRYDTLLALSREGAGTPDELREAEADARIAELHMASVEEELEEYALQLEEIQALIDQRRIQSEIDGVVTDVHREPGEFVSSVNPEVATVVDLSRLRISFFMPTSKVADLEQDAEVNVRFVGPNRELAIGKVEYIGDIIQADSGRVRVDVLIDNPNGEYRSGLRCALELNSKVAGHAFEIK